MLGLFKKKSEKQKLQDQYKKLMEQSYKLSHSDRTASDAKAAEADAIAQRIAGMESSSRRVRADM